ncbi:MAG: NlpC/P60 family protein [Candidatus Sericytochromatia bacterium]
MESLKSFKNIQQARDFASKNQGNEAIVKNKDGYYTVNSLNKNENTALRLRDSDKFSKDIVEFSIDVSGSKDNVVTKDSFFKKLSGQKFKTLDDARKAAIEHEGNETIVRANDGTYKVFSFVEQKKIKAVEKRDFSKLDKNVLEVSIEKADGTNKTITKSNIDISDVGKKAQVMMGYTQTLLNNIKNNKYDNNNYGLGDEYVNVAKGTVDADCSGFVTAMLNKAGVPAPRETAKGYGNMIRNGNNHLSRVKNASEVRQGDILAYERVGNGWTGHIMIVTGKPQPIKSFGKIIGYNINIVDSTSIAHTNDNRRGGSGVGTGTVSVRVDKNGNMTGFHWFANLNGRNESNKVTVGRIKE